jgi:hypothetical protein
MRRIPLPLGILAIQTRLCLCQGNDDKKNDSFEILKQPNFEKFDLQTAGKSFYELVENGAPGKIGYGFMMGYSSGFCLKKVCHFIPTSFSEVWEGVKSCSICCWRDVYPCSDPLIARVLASQP